MNSTIKSMEKKHKIFTTALLLFEKKGYDNVSINEICQQMGLTKGAFYHHFKSKSDILILKYKVAAETLLNYYQTILNDPPVEKLRKIINRFINYPGTTSLEEMKSSFKVQIDSQYQHFLGDSTVQKSILLEIIAEGQATGDIRKDFPAEQLADIIIRYKFGLYIEWCINDGKTNIQMVGERDFDAILKFLSEMPVSNKNT